MKLLGRVSGIYLVMFQIQSRFQGIVIFVEPGLLTHDTMCDEEVSTSVCLSHVLRYSAEIAVLKSLNRDIFWDFHWKYEDL